MGTNLTARHVAALAAAVLLGTQAPVPVLAQDGSTPKVAEIGQRVRITAPSRSMLEMVGTVQGRTANGLLFRPDEGAGALEVPFESVTRLQIRRRHSNAGTGALIGGLVGGVLGGVAGAASGCDADQWCVGPAGGSLVALGVVLVGGVGAGLGALIGSAIHSEGWRDVRIPDAAPPAGLTLLPAAGPGVRVGWSLRL